MTPAQPEYMTLALLWIAGVPFGLLLRFGFWASKQTEAVTLGHWWSARLGANVISIGLAIPCTLFWAEGSLYNVCHLEKIGLGLTYGLTPIASAAVTFFSHYILAAGRRKAEAIAGGPVDGAGD